MTVPPVRPEQEQPAPTPLARARSAASRARAETERRARRLLRRQLTRARSSDSELLQRAYVLGRQGARRAINSVTHRQVGWVATLWGARWLEGTTYEIRGWAYERGYGHTSPPRIEVVLARPGGRVPVEAEVTPVVEMEVNAHATKGEFDYANTAFVARVDLAPVLADDDPRPWEVLLRVTGADGRAATGTLKYRHRDSSARMLGARTFSGGVQLVPRWVRRHGLFFDRVVPATLARDVAVEGRHVRAEVELRGITAQRVELISRYARRPVEVQDGGQRDGVLRVVAEIPETWVVLPEETDLLAPETEEVALDTQDATPETAAEEAGSEQSDDGAPVAQDDAREGQRRVAQTYQLVVVDQDGTEHVVATALDQSGPVQAPGSGLLAYAGSGGALYVADPLSHLVVTGTEVEPGEAPRLRLRGTWGGELEHLELAFAGRRQVVPASADLRPDGTWTAEVDLLQPLWGGPARLPRTGSYTLRGRDAAGGSVRVMAAPELVARTPEKLPVEQARLRWEIGKGRSLRLRVGLTRAPDELGSFHQRRMDAAYLAGPHEPQRSVYLESFYGRLATCNPHALDAVIAREHPDWVRYWGVTDLSVPVPEGAVSVVEGTQAWFDARARSRFVIANDWLRRRFTPQPFQTVLQTWHGSMFKRIGLDRPNVGASTREALALERDKWDVLLSQNHHSTEIFRSAYAWEGVFYEEGYPRNDALVEGSGEQVRERLGIRPDQKAVLYAPTWRDNAAGMVVFLDLERLTADLGDDYVVLLRGHSRTVGHGRSVDLPGVVDVTTYPSITELFLAADAMITDYSSVMFDYSVTRRPMIFYVPDLDEYRDDVRGVYFDLGEEAPGPVVATQDEVVAAIREMDDTQRYAERYARWVERFNHLDDGHSAERVVRRLFDGA
ncbi:CDP-glycerol:poly(glycerophosphate) glycerophosphotransferase [Serinicoccus hydrothermalis]|uniref:CDP-glycerol:poly(Glycerophosphate) glycerophosphotransferase n=1 Tax=Serinicoccus hydrothermalis TaxID=1758689 RepID=A0A1B1NBB4_9MICO|nr:CDP-glycerol glycerophosphotransferase family protein [Serinicoccus hydrothermalis]ANS78712.1 CDP-glycerol:poly(glycerophosphate) glycerophosphotransferase [Serinicoccus hydrothermalis]